MDELPAVPETIRFGLFEVELETGVLRKRGVPVPLQDKPFRLLDVLLSRAGEVVTRSELQKSLWPSGTYVEFEDGLNHAVKKLRDALGDSAASPVFIETVPRRGYRFVAPMELPEREDSSGKRDGRRALVSLVAAAGVLATALALSLFYLRSSGGQAETIRFSVDPPAGTGIPRQASVRVSPDGRHVAFVVFSEGSRALAVRSLDSVEAAVLEGTDGAQRPFWSPDSRRIGFFAWRELRTIGVDGSDPQTVCEGSGFVGGSWSEDEVILFGGRDVGGLYRVPAAGGRPHRVRAPDASRGEQYIESPHFLPDGEHYLYFSKTSDASTTGIYLGALGSEASKLLVRSASEAMYVPPGYLLVPRGEELVARAFDARSLALADEIVSLVKSVQYRQEVGAFSASGDVLVYREHAAPSTERELTWFDREGRSLGTTGEIRPWAQIALSPEGGRAVAVDHDPNGRERDIWILDLERGGPASRLTFHPGSDIHPTWSPDGGAIAFSSTRNGGSLNLYRKPVHGNGEPELLLSRPQALLIGDWSRDGKYLAYGAGREGPRGIYVLPLEGERDPIAVELSPFTTSSVKFSPDGRWVTYVSDETGRLEVYVRPLAPDGEKHQISNGGGSEPQWSRDGRELFYLALDGTLMAVETRPDERPPLGIPRALFQTGLPVEAEPFVANYAVAENGARFLVAVPTDEPEPITVVLNWTALLPPD